MKKHSSAISISLLAAITLTMVSAHANENAKTSYAIGVDLVANDATLVSAESLRKILKLQGFKAVRVRPYDLNRYRVRGISVEGHDFIADVSRENGVVLWSIRKFVKTIY